MRSRPRARSAAAPAGRRRMSWSRTRAAAWSPPRPAISRATARANTSSTTPGPTPTSGPAATITRSCRCAVPFTPVTGRRLLVAADAPEGARDALIGALARIAQADQGLVDPRRPSRPQQDAERLAKAGFLIRTGEQFHFSCEDYATFDDFLAALASRKRKAIKRERRDALENGIDDRMADRRRDPIRALGRLLRVLHGYGLAQSGDAPTSPAPSSI